MDHRVGGKAERVGSHAPSIAAALAAIPLAFALGSASPGQPLPPSLNLPGLAQKLTAERVGDQVTLSWTTPATATDGPKLKGAITARVCLDTAPSTNPAPPPASTRNSKRQKKSPPPPPFAPAAPAYNCNTVQQGPVTPGASRFSVALSPSLATGSATLVAYRIELQNAKARSAGPSPPVFVAAGAPPPAPGVLNISARRKGALVQWKPVSEAATSTETMELKRTLIATPTGPVEAPAATAVKAPKAPLSPTAPRTPAREVVLRPEGANAPGTASTDQGGMIDGTIADGDTYTYVAQRVQTVTLADHTLEVRSVPSPVATFTYHDVFPPMPPTGLVLVPGGGFGEAPSIDLSWEANFDTDMLGYNVYRSQGAGEFVRLTPEPLPSPAFRDLQVEPGQQYTYRVTAVDLRHNESAPSTTATETLRK